MKRLFSGIQPSGELHVGNYVGAVRNWVRLQADYSCFFCIVDYHAITQPCAPADMPVRTLDMAVGLLAAGRVEDHLSKTDDPRLQTRLLLARDRLVIAGHRRDLGSKPQPSVNGR